MNDALIERVARIIDPESWAVMDGYLADTKRKYAKCNAAYDPEAFKHQKSMAIARSVVIEIEKAQAIREGEQA